MPSKNRHLVAIMFTDIVGYSRVMGEDEQLALQILKKNREVHKKTIGAHGGKWLKEMGDGTLASFSTSSDAVYCAGELIESCTNQNISLRIGIHEGEITEETGDIFGDGVNLASRIEPLAEPGQILVSGSVHLNVKNKLGVKSSFIKEAELKNIDESIKLYGIEITVPNKKVVESKLIQEVLSESSIAVLPFVNMSNDPEQEFFCDGISEEIINTIVQYPHLKVSGRTSSFSFKGKNEDLRTIGTALGVSKILEGSIRKMGNRIRITAQLIEASSGFHIWSNKYDRQLDDIFAIQDEIAEEIGNQLNLTLSKGSEKLDVRQQTQNLAAYQLYLKGRILFYNRGNSMFEALDCFRKALAIDSTYALASAGLSDAYVMLILHGYLPAKTNWKFAVEASKNAFSNGPGLAETNNSLAIISLFYEWNWDKAEQQFKKAIEINPSFIQAYVWYGYFHQVFVAGKMKSGLKLIEKAVEIDPLSGYPRICLGSTALQMGAYQTAVKVGETHIELDPLNNLAQLNLGSAYFWAGDYKKSGVSFDRASKDAGIVWLYTQVMQHIKENKVEKAKAVHKTMENHYETHNLIPTTFAIACAHLGENEKAIKALKVACDIKEPALVFFIAHHKDGEVLHSLPGYDTILNNMRLKKP